MTHSNESSPHNKTPELTIQAHEIAPGFNTVLRINQEVRRLIIDYALAAAILGLIPLHANKWGDAVSLVLLGLLNLKLIQAIGKRWGYPKGQDGWALLSSLLNVFGAFAIAIVARLLISTLSLFVPLAIVLSAPIGHAILTWALGRAAHHYYFSTQKVSPQALHNLLEVHHQKHS